LLVKQGVDGCACGRRWRGVGDVREGVCEARAGFT
jgi:hypothetical protein